MAGIYISDAFTASNGTAIDGRTPDVTVGGATWAKRNFYRSDGTTSGTIDIQSNKARMTVTDEGFQIDTGQTDFLATWYCTPPSLSSNFRGGMRFRVQSSTSTSYYFATIRFDLGTGNIRIVKVVSGVDTVIGSDVTMSFSAGTTYRIDLIVSGSTFTFYVDGTQKKQETDTTFTSGTIHGFGAGAVSGQDFTIDSVEIKSITTSGTISLTQDNFTPSISGTVPIIGSFSKTGLASALSATGTVESATEITGSFSQTGSASTLSSTGTLIITGSFAQTGASSSFSSAGVLDISASFSQTGGQSTFASTGTLDISGSFAQTGTSSTFSSTGAIVVSGSFAQTGSSSILTAYGNNGTITITQEGYRFRNDDGNETTATWMELQDTDVFIKKNINTRLRILVDTQGITGNKNYVLEWSKKISDDPETWDNWNQLSSS